MTGIDDYAEGFEESKKKRIQQKNDEIIQELEAENPVATKVKEEPVEQPKEEPREQPQEPAKENVVTNNQPTPRAKPAVDITDRVTRVCDLPINDDEKKMILKSRIGGMIEKNKVNAMPTLITCRYRTATVPVKVLCEIDHQILKEAWQFYSTNVQEPTSEGFMEILREVTKNHERVYQRVAELNLL